MKKETNDSGLKKILKTNYKVSYKEKSRVKTRSTRYASKSKKCFFNQYIIMIIIYYAI